MSAEKASLSRDALLAIQQLVMVAGSSAVVAYATGLSLSVALLGAGVSTAAFQLLTHGRVPVYLGASALAVAAFACVREAFGEVTSGTAIWGMALWGGVYIVTGIGLGVLGRERVRRIVSPAVSASIVAVVGLCLAAVGARALAQDPAAGLIAAAAMVVVSLRLRGRVRMFSVLVGLAAGTITAAALRRVDVSVIADAPMFAVPLPSLSVWTAKGTNGEALAVIAAFALVGAVADVGRLAAAGEATSGSDILQEPGMKRSRIVVALQILGLDAEARSMSRLSWSLVVMGAVTLVSAIAGSPPSSVSARSVGVSAASGVANARVTYLTALGSILIAFLAPSAAAIGSVPASALGGITVVLGALIAVRAARIARRERARLWGRNADFVSAFVVAVGVAGVALGWTAGATIAAAGAVGLLAEGILPGGRWPLARQAGDWITGGERLVPQFGISRVPQAASEQGEHIEGNDVGGSEGNVREGGGKAREGADVDHNIAEPSLELEGAAAAERREATTAEGPTGNLGTVGAESGNGGASEKTEQLATNQG